MNHTSIRILGIDPGSRQTGLGLVSVTGGPNTVRFVDCDTISLGNLPFFERLGLLASRMQDYLENFSPDVVAVEQVFLSNNVMSALKLGQARGAALALVAARGIPIIEYGARHIKLALVGTGRAEKCQVQTMVRHLLKLPQLPQADAADALALAICHGVTRQYDAHFL